MSQLPSPPRARPNPHSPQHPANLLALRPLARCFALGALALVVWLWSPSAQADITLANRGHSEYRIVIAAQPLPSEHYAATELQS